MGWGQGTGLRHAAERWLQDLSWKLPLVVWLGQGTQCP